MYRSQFPTTLPRVYVDSATMAIFWNVSITDGEGIMQAILRSTNYTTVTRSIVFPGAQSCLAKMHSEGQRLMMVMIPMRRDIAEGIPPAKACFGASFSLHNNGPLAGPSSTSCSSSSSSRTIAARVY